VTGGSEDTEEGDRKKYFLDGIYRESGFTPLENNGCIGDSIAREDVERAIELSVSKYCSVSVMLGKSAVMSHSARSVGEKEEITS
jgi:hypothetical protein